MMPIDRRAVLGLSLAPLAFALAGTPAQSKAPLDLLAAEPGSAFLAYGRGLQTIITGSGIAPCNLVETRGSDDNIERVEASERAIGMVFLGALHDALSGGSRGGRPATALRALFPLYETSFMTAALRATSIASVKALDGKKVGCGADGDQAQAYLAALAGVAGIKPDIVTGSPVEQVAMLLAGDLDALWHGAVVPIPSLVLATRDADCAVFGLNSFELARMRTRFPFLAEAVIPAGTYRGQSADIRSVAAWNMLVGNKDLPEPEAYALVKGVLTARNLVDVIGAPARSTSAANAPINTMLPYHPGAARALAELGVAVAAQP